MSTGPTPTGKRLWPTATGKRPRPDPGTRRVERDHHRAWLSLGLFPVSFIAAYVVGEGMASLFGYSETEDDGVPLWMVLVAGLPAVVVFAMPAMMSIYFGRHAVRAGRRSALVPMLGGAVLAALFVIVTFVSYLVGGHS